MKIKWRMIFILFIISVLYMHCSAQDSSYQQINSQTIYLYPERITVFPNPVPANADISIEIDSSCDYYLARIVVCDFSNVIIKDEIVKVQKGDNKFLVNMGGYNQGNYLVKIIAKKDKPFLYSSQFVVR